MSDAIRPEHAFLIHRVEVIEWLHPGDLKTGSLLVQRYGASGRLTFHLTPCQSADDVHAALVRIAANTTLNNIPIIHVEAHGYGGGPEAPAGLAGPNGKGGEQELPWEYLLPVLTAINIASGFNLMVAGAACHGDAVIWRFLDAIPENGSRVLPFPFMAALGPEEAIEERTLLRAFEAFYDGLVRGLRVDMSIIRANAVLGGVGRLDWLSVYNVVNTVMDAPEGPPASSGLALIAKALGHDLSESNRRRFPLMRVERPPSDV